METSRVREIMNQQINDSISYNPDITTMFNNPELDLSSLGITSQSEFILGAVWASSINYFINAFANRYYRIPTDKVQQEAIYTLFHRGNEIREAIGKITGP